MFSFPPGTEMFHFPGFALSSLCIQPECTSRSRVSGLPHSEIHGSKPVSGSPWLIAAVHVLHRLSSPRHPPRALRSLTISLRRVHGILHPDRPRHARAGQGQDSMHFACRSTTLSESRWRPKARVASHPVTPSGRLVALDHSRAFTSLSCLRRCVRRSVELIGFEPTTPGLQSRCSPN